MFFPSLSFGDMFAGSAWILYESDGNKKIVLLEHDGTFTQFNLVMPKGNEGRVYGDEDETWKSRGNNLVLSFNSGFRIMSLRINASRDKLKGTSISQNGSVVEIIGKIID